MKRNFSLFLCRVGGHYFSTRMEDLEYVKRKMTCVDLTWQESKRLIFFLF
jgi:hypothetical protein